MEAKSNNFDIAKQLEQNESNSSKNVEPMVIASNPVSSRHQETYHRMIERVKDYHSKLDVAKHKGKGKVDLFVCSICFGIFPEQEALRNHFIKVY